MTGELAIIGAGGFVGATLVEALVRRGDPAVRAVVRSYRSMAPFARFGPAVRAVRADAEYVDVLTPALEGCEVAVNLTTGAPAGIERSTRAIYEACRKAGVRRLVHLSSAVVVGDVPSAAIHDDSPPLTDHWMPYARAKGAAETWLRAHGTDPRCEVVVLRPGIVWGVRSQHTLGIAKTLIRKSAYLVDGGQGIFNGIYVDNLVECIRAAATHPGAVSGFFNVADPGTRTWRDLYAHLGGPLGVDVERLPNVSGSRFPLSVGAVIEYVQLSPLVDPVYHRLKRRLPDGIKARLKAILQSPEGYEVSAAEYATRPTVSRELWHLQKTSHQLPTDKFNRQFRCGEMLSFPEGIRRTLQWLRFLGYLGEAAGPAPRRAAAYALESVAA